MLALMHRRNTLISIATFTPSISINVNTSFNASIKIQMDSEPIQTVQDEVFAWCELSLSKFRNILSILRYENRVHISSSQGTHFFVQWSF